MKVLHVYNTYLPENFEGIPRVIFAIAEGVAPLGASSEVLTLSDHPSADAILVGNHSVHTVKRDLAISSAGFSFGIFGKFAELAGEADIVHYHTPWPIGDLLNLAAGRSRPSVVTYHSDIVRQKLFLPVYAPLMHSFLKHADSIVATSPNYAETSPVLARYRSKLSIIPIGLPARTPVSAEKREYWRRRVGENFFLFVGAFRYYKGLQFLVEAARLSGLPVVVAGAEDLSGVAAGTVPDNIHIVGRIAEDDKEALLDLCLGFVFPSHLRSEAFGIALVEAARAGKPAITCEIGTGTSYVNVDGLTGLVVPPEDPIALAETMKKLSADHALAKKLGEGARNRQKSLFQDCDMSKAYFEIYRRLVETPLAKV